MKDSYLSVLLILFSFISCKDVFESPNPETHLWTGQILSCKDSLPLGNVDLDIEITYRTLRNVFADRIEIYASGSTNEVGEYSIEVEDPPKSWNTESGQFTLRYQKGSNRGILDELRIENQNRSDTFCIEL